MNQKDKEIIAGELFKVAKDLVSGAVNKRFVGLSTWDGREVLRLIDKGRKAAKRFGGDIVEDDNFYNREDYLKHYVWVKFDNESDAAKFKKFAERLNGGRKPDVDDHDSVNVFYLPDYYAKKFESLRANSMVAKTLKDPWKERDVQASILKNAGDMIEETGIYEQGWWDPNYRRDISKKLDALGKYVRKVEKDILRMTDDIQSTEWETT